MPKIAPTPDSSGGLLFWSLAPFQIPDDIRIQDGHSYRLLWVDAQGRLIPPQSTTHLPALHAFLGPPDPEPSTEDKEYEAILRNVTDPALRRSAEKKIAESRLDTINLRREAEEIRQHIALSDAGIRERNAAEEHARERRKEQRKEQERADKKLAKITAKREKENDRNRTRYEWVEATKHVGIPVATGLISLLVQKFILNVPIDPQMILNEVKKVASVAAGEKPKAAKVETTAATPEVVAAHTSAPTLTIEPAPAPVGTPEAESTSAGTAAPEVTSAEENQTTPAMESMKESAQESVPIQIGGAEAVASAAPIDVSEAKATVAPTADAAQESLAPAGEPGTSAEALECRPVSLPDFVPSMPPVVMDRAKYITTLVSKKQALYDAFHQLTETEKMDFMGVLMRPALECGLLFTLERESLEVSPVEPRVQTLLDSLSDDDWASVERFADSQPLMTAYQVYCQESAGQPWRSGGVTENQAHAMESEPLPPIADGVAVAGAPQIHAESSVSERAPVEVGASAALPGPVPAAVPIPAPQVLTPDQARVAVSIVMDPEKTAHFVYEANRLQAIADGRQPPKEPQTDLSVAQRQEVRELASTADLRSQVVAVRQKFIELCNRGVEALFQLPAPFPSLTASDREWISEAVATGERRAYLVQIQRRQAALLSGDPLPILDPAGLSAKEQKQVRRIARDWRALEFVARGGTRQQQ